MLNWLFGDKKRAKRAGQSDRAERNAIIRRVVAAAAKSSNKRDPQVIVEHRSHATSDSQVVGPMLLSSAHTNASLSGNIPQDRVAERAYEIWIRNGRPTGTAERDWQQAMAELCNAEASAQHSASTSMS